jgi:D-amino peptidase
MEEHKPTRREFLEKTSAGLATASVTELRTSSTSGNPDPSLSRTGASQSEESKKVLVLTDMEGVDGIFDIEQQCIPFKSPRWEESRKLLTGEINAAVEGLLESGAKEVVIWDGHWDGENLSALDIHPRARLLSGPGVGKVFKYDSSYSAMLFVGQHAMAGAERGILGHSKSPEGIQNIWVNNKLVGEIGLEVMHAGAFGVPVIMLAGDTAACAEIRDLVPRVECAEVKSGISRTGGFTLSHTAACALIRETARSALNRLSDFGPYKISGSVEIKVEYTPVAELANRPVEGYERLNERTWAVRGKDYLEAYQRFLYL